PTPRSTVISISRAPPLPIVAGCRSGLRISTPAGGATSPAVTSAGPLALREIGVGSARAGGAPRAFRVRMVAGGASGTLATGGDSLSTPRDRADGDAGPGLDASHE